MTETCIAARTTQEVNMSGFCSCIYQFVLILQLLNGGPCSSSLTLVLTAEKYAFLLKRGPNLLLQRDFLRLKICISSASSSCILLAKHIKNREYDFVYWRYGPVVPAATVT